MFMLRRYLSTSGNVNKAIQFDAKAKKLALVEKRIPCKIGPTEVLVQVHYAGICGTDLHIIDGEFPCKQDAPLVLGHEFSGIVERIGRNVTHVEEEDNVVVDPNISCKVCRDCQLGLPHYCKTGSLNAYIGMFSDGGWEQYALVPACQVHKVPDSITLEQAALCEPLSCVSHAWDRVSPVPIGKRILVLGCGIIGNLFVSLLHLQGHKNVTVSELSKARINMTERLDTDYDIISPDCLKERQKQDPDYMFDVVLESTGNAKAIEHAYTMLDYGGKMCIFGVANPAVKMSISPYDMFLKELSVIGTAVNPYSFPRALNYIESMGSRYINYKKLGVKKFPLEDYEDAIKYLRKGAIAKATFKIEH